MAKKPTTRPARGATSSGPGRETISPSGGRVVRKTMCIIPEHEGLLKSLGGSAWLRKKLNQEAERLAKKR